MTNKVCTYNGKEFSEGAEICQGGTVKHCSNGEWEETNKECDDKVLQSLLNGIELISEEEANKFFKGIQLADANASSFREISRFARSSSIRRTSRYLEFEGAKTPGRVCSGDTGRYRVPLDDLRGFGEELQCTSSYTTLYKKITYLVPGRD